MQPASTKRAEVSLSTFSRELVKQAVKGLLNTIAPRWTTAIVSARGRAYSQQLLARWGCGPVNQKLVAHFGLQVQAGPFAGLQLTEMTQAEQLGPYLLGVYESELDGAWEILRQGTYPQILDIGAKFGYYAVGLARHYPAATVVAFDTDWWARQALRQMAAANGTSNVVVQGFCSAAWLVRHTQAGALIVSDCEGYEGTLFTPTTLRYLQTATLLIETHDCFQPGIQQQLREVLEPSHVLRSYYSAIHRRPPLHPLDFLTATERPLAVQEARPPEQCWLLCLPKTGPNQRLQAAPTA